MNRRAIVLLGLLATSVALLLRVDPRLEVIRRVLSRPIPAMPVESMIEDPAGALGVARRAIEEKIRMFAVDLGIGIGITVDPVGSDPGPASAEPATRRQQAVWHTTGHILVRIDEKRRRVEIERSPALESVLPEELLRERVAERVEPFVGGPLAGVALVSGLERLQDHLLETAHTGELALDRQTAERSVLAALRKSQPGIEARCRSQASGDEVAARVDQLACALATGLDRDDERLFTAASRFHLERRPLSRFDERCRAHAIETARPWTVSVTGDYAAARSSDAKATGQPVLLRREGAEWRIDLVEMEKAFRRTGTTRWMARSTGGPYWLALEAGPVAAFDIDLGPVELWSEPLAEAVARLERTDTSEARIRLAEILLRNAWLPGEALVQWSRAFELSPIHVDFAKIYADRADYIEYPLLGAIALAPYGPPVATRIAELLMRSGWIETGAEFFQKAIQWRNARDAARAEARAGPPSI